MKVEVVIRQDAKTQYLASKESNPLILRNSQTRSGYVELSIGKESIELESNELITAINKATI